MATILKRVTEATGLARIHALQSANPGRHLPSSERMWEGFLTSEYTLGFLERLHRHAPAVIAVEGDAVVGYALVATPAARRYLVCPDICVARSHRGTGLLARLYARMRADLAPAYDCVITDMARANARSLAAHRRAGFDVCSSLDYDGQTRDLVIWDWAGPQTP